LCAGCSIYDPSLLDGLSSGGSAGRAGSGGAGAAGEGGSSGDGNAGTSAGISGAGGASGGGIGSDASNDRDSSSGKGGGIGVDVTNDGDGRGGAGGADGSGGTSSDDSGSDGASGDGGASGTSGAAGSGGTGIDAGGDADGSATDVAGGTDGGDGGDGRTTCASYPVSGKPSWVVTASHTSLGNSQESDPLYNPPSHAHDGILAERWSTGKPQSGNEWLQVDFGRSVAISQATLQLGSSTSDHPRGYAVRVSETPLDFAAPILVSGAGQASVDIVILFGVPVVGRYLLIAQTGSATSWWSVAEVNAACTD